MHGHEASKGATIDEEIFAEESVLRRKRVFGETDTKYHLHKHGMGHKH